MDITQNIPIPDLFGMKRKASMAEFNWIPARDEYGTIIPDQSKIVIKIVVRWYYDVVVDQVHTYGGEIEAEKPIGKRLIKPYFRDITADNSTIVDAAGMFADPATGTMWVDRFPQYFALIEASKSPRKIFEDIRAQIEMAGFTERLDYVVS